MRMGADPRAGGISSVGASSPTDGISNPHPHPSGLKFTCAIAIPMWHSVLSAIEAKLEDPTVGEGDGPGGRACGRLDGTVTTEK